MGKLLITGATGYIGAEIAQYYLEKGLKIRLLVRDRKKLAPRLQQHCEIVVSDLIHPETLKQAVTEIDAVIHAAGQLGSWGVLYQQMYETNAQGVHNLLEATSARGSCRFIHLSAGGVTGPLPTKVVDETYAPAPRTDYERSKWEGEKIALQMAAERDLNLLVLRPTFTYGPGDPHKLNLFKAIQKGHFVFIGDGFSTIHPVYIDDLRCGIDLALQSSVKGRALIIGGPKPVTKLELVYTIADELKAPKPKLKIPAWMATTVAGICEAGSRVIGFNPPLTRSRVLMMSKNWGYSIASAQELLGYHPAVDLQEGVKRTVAWYREKGWL